jgi:hypothetical protein
MICQKTEWINTQNELQPKALKLLTEADALFKSNKRKKKILFDTPEFSLRLEEFRNMFPKGNLPTGKPARTNLTELKKKMSAFFIQNPKYDWDLVLDATEAYVEHFRKQDYNYMRTAGYFISKDGDSELASYCQLLLEDDGVGGTKKSHYNAS